jgi:hypothetical protein
VIGKEIAIVREGVAVPEKETESVIVVTETERGIGGTENVIEETGNSCDNMYVFLSYHILPYVKL